MTQTIESHEGFLAWQPLTRILGDTRRSMGRLSHLQGSNLPGGLTREGITHASGTGTAKTLVYFSGRRVTFGKKRR